MAPGGPHHHTVTTALRLAPNRGPWSHSGGFWGPWQDRTARQPLHGVAAILTSSSGANEGAWQRGVEPTMAEGGVVVLVLPGDGLGTLWGLGRTGRGGGISMPLHDVAAILPSS